MWKSRGRKHNNFWLKYFQKGNEYVGKLGIQLFSVWQYAEKDYLGTVEKLADLGYEGIQLFANFYNTSAVELKRLMDRKGVVPAGSHVSINQLQGDRLEKTLEYHAEIDNKLLICPALPEDMRKNADDYRKSAQILNQIGEKCKQNGFTFGYHNHAFEFKKIEETTGFDLLFDQTDPELVKIELDCFWAIYAGFDPIQIIQKYKERCVSLHMIDYKLQDGKKVNTEIGDGLFNLGEIVQVAKNYNIPWFTIEQEYYENDPFESLKMNAKNMRDILVE